MRYKKENRKGKIYHGNVKTLTVQNQIYDIFVNGDKVLIKKTVRGQQIDYREVNIEKRNNISDSDGSELGRLSNIVDMYDYEYQDVKIKVNLVLVESYYKVNAEGKKELKFRKKTQNLLEKDQLFGKDLGVFLATNEDNIAQDGNVINGNVISIKTKNSIIQGTEKLIATIGLEDIIIVDTKDAILICNKDNTQEVKAVINNLKICNRTEYL